MADVTHLKTEYSMVGVLKFHSAQAFVRRLVSGAWKPSGMPEGTQKVAA